MGVADSRLAHSLDVCAHAGGMFSRKDSLKPNAIPFLSWPIRAHAVVRQQVRGHAGKHARIFLAQIQVGLVADSLVTDSRYCLIEIKPLWLVACTANSMCHC